MSQLKDFANEIGAVLIFDEITSGFRMCVGGLHLKYGIAPDIAVFAKSIANGYAMAAIIGTENVMNSAQSTFISSTNWTERIGPTAALATIEKYINENVAEHIIDTGVAVKKIWETTAKKIGLSLTVSGLPSLGSFYFNHPDNQIIQTFFSIEMLKRGFLGFRQFKPSFAHKNDHLLKYEKAVNEVFALIKDTDPESMLTTPPAHSGFARLTKE